MVFNLLVEVPKQVIFMQPAEINREVVVKRFLV